MAKASRRSATGSATSRLAWIRADLVDLPAASVAAALAGLDVWIVDALRYTPHPSHFSVADALDWIARLKPKRAILTNMHADLDYAELKARLPAHIEPAFDGMRVEVGGNQQRPERRSAKSAGNLRQNASG